MPIQISKFLRSLRPVRSGIRLNAYLLLLVAVAVVPVLVVSGLVVFETTETFRSSSLARLNDTTVPLARAVESEIRKAKEFVIAVAHHGEEAGDEQIAGNLAAKTFGGVIVSERIEAGKLASENLSAKGLPMEAIRRSRESGRAAISNLYSAGADQALRFAIVFAEPLDQTAVGVTALQVHPERMIQLLQNGGFQEGNLLIAVTDGTGRLVSRSRDARKFVGKPVPDWAKLQSLNADHGTFDAVTKEGGKVIFSFQEVGNTPGWVVVSGEPLDAFNARWLKPLQEIVVGSVVAILLALAVSLWVSRRILGPVKVLARHADDVSSGREGEPLRPFAIAEFESLRVSLGRSEQSLRQRMESEKRAALRLSAGEKRYRTLAEAGAMVFWTGDLKGSMVAVTGWQDLTGADEHWAMGTGWTTFVHPEDYCSMDQQWHREAKGSGTVDQEFRVRTEEGEWRWVRARATLVDTEEEPQWIGVIEDIDARRKAQSRIAYMAHHDSLTGLGNRELLRGELSSAIASERGGYSMLAIDLDRFKAVNDTLGHSCGDELLMEVARRIRSAVSQRDFVARIGGDEFAILHRASSLEDSAALAQLLVDRLSQPYHFGEISVVVGASVGIAGFDGSPAEALMQKADIALYEAKAAGKGAFRIFEPTMDDKVQKRSRIERDLRVAISGGQLEVYYQPLMNPNTRRLAGFEALLRWNHPTRGLLGPDEFIPVAEDTGMMVQIGEMVLREACRQAATWPEDIKVSVNVSPVQLANERLAASVLDALNRSGLQPRRLELEITEHALVANIESAMAALLRLKALGCGIVMDDFGSGGSSLSYLKAFPFTRVKIDKCFMLNLDSGPENKAIVQAVTAICGSLGITSTAEGVETEEQLAFAQLQNCSEVQGYLFGRPRPASEIGHVISRLHGGSVAPTQTHLRVA